MTETPIQVTRFKLDDGREGCMAPLGNGLTKLLFDDGDMIIVFEAPPATEESEPAPIHTMTEES